MDSEPEFDHAFDIPALAGEVEHLEKLQRHLHAFPPNGEATWALLRSLGGLCRTCLRLTAPPDSGSATTPGFRRETSLSCQAVRNAQASGPKGCPLCRAVHQAAEHSHGMDFFDTGTINIRISSPSRMDLRELEWSQRFATISLRRGQIYLG